MPYHYGPISHGCLSWVEKKGNVKFRVEEVFNPRAGI